MGCGCGAKGRTSARNRGAARVSSQSPTPAPSAGATRLFFFVIPPKGSDEPEQRFTTIYAARSWAKNRKGWTLTSRREPIA